MVRPKYSQIFQYIESNFPMGSKSSPMESFWVTDIESNQYPNLDGPVSEDRTTFSSPEEAAETIRSFAKAAGASIVGFSDVTDEIVFLGAEVSEKNCIVIAYEMDREAILTAPDPPAGIEALRAYWRLGRIIQSTAEFIRYMGYPARGHQVRTYLKDPPTILNTLAAYKAGLGEVGRNGLLITREYGPRVRIGTITTDLPLPKGGPIDLGVDRFCSTCRRCLESCRGKAIPYEKDQSGKYTIDPKKCAPEFAKYDGCGICIAVCPFSNGTVGGSD